MKTPAFWSKDGPLPRLLEPLAGLYSLAGWWRMRRTPAAPPCPLICVGNVVAGGAGKTPVALDLLARLTASGLSAHALLRGYGGSERGPLAVQPAQHSFEQVGDEALLLATQAPTWVARDRRAGAAAAAAAGAGVVVMDDGFQNPALRPTLSLLVIDGATGLGNGRVMPSGPLREPLARALARLQQNGGAVVMLGDDQTGLCRRLPAGLPVLFGDLRPDPQAVARLQGRRVVAFAGIGRPAKFFASLRALGAQVVASHPFADHYPYEPADIQPILDEAFALQAIPVTTAKDAVRLGVDQRQQVDILPISVQWRDLAALKAVLAPVLAVPDRLRIRHQEEQ